MQTFYVDIYFFINFTVDILALHFASVLSKVPIRSIKLILLTTFLSALACFRVLFLDDSVFLGFVCFLLCAFVILISLKGIGLSRRIRILFLFLIINFLIGGIVSFIYQRLSNIIKPDEFNTQINRTLLLFAMAILFVYGILKLFQSAFANRLSEKSAKIKITLLDKTVYVDCLVDTGNLVVDPIDSTPVLLLKENIWGQLVSFDIHNVDKVKNSIYAKYLRIIPIKKDNSNEICYGLRPDYACYITKSGEEEIRLVFVLDKLGGSFGGYYGLLPATLLEGLE